MGDSKKPTEKDLLQKEYHEIGIPSVAAACCVKHPERDVYGGYTPKAKDKKSVTK